MGNPWATNGRKLTGLTRDVLGYGCSHSVCWGQATIQRWRSGALPAESLLSQGEKPSSQSPIDTASVVGVLLIWNSRESSFHISLSTVNSGSKHLYSKHGYTQQSLSIYSHYGFFLDLQQVRYFPSQGIWKVQLYALIKVRQAYILRNIWGKNYEMKQFSHPEYIFHLLKMKKTPSSLIHLIRVR